MSWGRCLVFRVVRVYVGTFSPALPLVTCSMGRKQAVALSRSCFAMPIDQVYTLRSSLGLSSVTGHFLVCDIWAQMATDYSGLFSLKLRGGRARSVIGPSPAFIGGMSGRLR